MGALRFTKKTRYGLIMLSLLASKKEGHLSAEEMRSYGLPRHFPAKIAQELIKAGMIGSKEGRGGGYHLTCNPEEVTLREVVEVLEGPVSTAECTVHGNSCPFAGSCPQETAMKEITLKIKKVLDNYKISDLRS